jgi:gas vesicle protein
MAYRKSIAANNLSVESNKIAKEANRLIKSGMAYDRGKAKQQLIDEIINRIIDNWTKNGGAISNLLNEWKINNQNFTKLDFDNIWNTAYQRVKSKVPDKSFQDLLNEYEKKES